MIDYNNIDKKQLIEGFVNLEKAIEESSIKKVIVKVVSGPYVYDSLIKYRVELGGMNIVATLRPLLKVKLVKDDEVVLVDSMIIDKLPKELLYSQPRRNYKLSTWDSVIGLDEQMSDIKSSIKTLSISDKLYKEFGVKPVKGAVLYGPPGCGKTLIAKCIASDIFNDNIAEEGQFTLIKGAEILNKYVGETESTIISIFKNAREYTKRTGNKAMIFIDEADAILGKRNDRNISSTVVPTFLSEMDGLEDNNPFVLLSTNLVDSLDEAIIRDGRMDLKIKIDRPNQKGLSDLFMFYLSKVKCHDNITELSNNGAEYIITSKNLFEKASGALVENVVNLTAKLALERYVYSKDMEKEPKGIIFNDLANCLIKIEQNV